MQPMSNPKPSDDPHDIVVVAPDAIRVVPADEEIESLLKEKVRAPSEPQPPSEPHLHVEPQLRVAPEVEASAPVPPVDTTFRATAVNEILNKGRRRSMAGRLLRGVAALLLAACIGGAAMAWRYHGDAAQQMIADWLPLFAGKSSQSPEKTALAAPPVLAAAEVNAANASPAPPAETGAPPATAEAAAAPAVAASAAEPQSLETMARDLANASQQIEQLKASVEQLKASQQQLVAMVAEKEKAAALRPKKPAQAAPPPRPVAALTPARTTAPPPPLPPRPYRPAAAPIMPSSAAAPLPPPAPAYVPRQVEPQSAETLNDPELTSVPRPPMPLR
ncbi:MAG: hypothetical protein J0H42_27885 [Rhizobiales bacterium]|nr:hypothetical protein [Hyphomicrobiales bacterium]